MPEDDLAERLEREADCKTPPSSEWWNGQLEALLREAANRLRASTHPDDRAAIQRALAYEAIGESIDANQTSGSGNAAHGAIPSEERDCSPRKDKGRGPDRPASAASTHPEQSGRKLLQAIGEHLAAGGPATEADRSALLQAIEAALEPASPTPTEARVDPATTEDAG